jgi:hypothetical protein
MGKNLFLLTLLIILLVSTAFIGRQQKIITGAWHLLNGTLEEILIFQDGYFSHTTFDKINKQFIQTRGGTYSYENDRLNIKLEFSSNDPESIGESPQYAALIQQGILTSDINGQTMNWNRVDDGEGMLAGNWRITGRLNDGEMKQMERGDRKTLKLLSGSRFQWMAINPATRQFSGTGGGTYDFENGNYTEHIEFFSRDSSRVGATLNFNGSVNGKTWTHKGMNSRGEPLHEEWTREN